MTDTVRTYYPGNPSRDRYGLKTRQSIYDWCKAANITLAKDEKNRAYATPEQIELFEQQNLEG